MAAAGTTSLVVEFTARARRKLAKLRSVRLTLELLATDPAGNVAKDAQGGHSQALSALSFVVISATNPRGGVMRSFLCVFVFVLTALVAPASASAAVERTFPASSLIIPMDVDFQDQGMLKAFGLVNKLLEAGIPVNWVVEPTKALYISDPVPGEVPPSWVDFTASATDVESGAAVSSHGYRGGPFVIDAAYHDVAMPIVTGWIAAHPSAVHRASADFVAPVTRVLVDAPTIAVLETGNQRIIFAYLNAAGIPDGDGNVWSDTSPGLLTPASVAGMTTTDHRDGTLFDAPTGQPAYNQLVAATWNAPDDPATPEAIAEIAEFLKHRTHVFASASAAIWIEDSAFGHFLTTDNGTGEPVELVAVCANPPPTTPNNGLCAASQPFSLSFFNADLVFAQLDGPFTTISGSVPAFGLAPESTYRDSGLVMARDAGEIGEGVRDVWLTGYAGGSCAIASSGMETPECAAVGKVSYLGGHQYATAVPISSNPDTQGVRLFLNSLLEAGSIGAPPLPLPPPPPPVATPVTTAPAPDTTAPAPNTTAPAPDTTAPALTLVVKARQKLLPALRKGLRATARCSEACAIQAKILLTKKLAKRLKLPRVVGKGRKSLAAAGKASMVVKFTPKARRKLAKLRSVRLTLELLATDAAGNAAKARKPITLRR